MTTPTPDRTPTGDLRERLAEAMCAHYIGDQTTAMGEHLCVCGEWADGTDTDDWDAHLADAVLPVVEAETAALRDRAERADDRAEAAGFEVTTARLAAREQRERAEEAERQRDEALAAVQRVRRTAQVWIDIQPTHPTLTNEARVLAIAAEQALAALAPPAEEDA